MNLRDLRTIKSSKKENKGVTRLIDSLYDSCVSENLKKHKEWYLNERFIRGEHWIVYNKTANKVMSLPTKKGQVRRTINKIRTQVRGVKNFIKRNQPRWEVHPDDSSDKALEEAKKKNKILQYIYRTKKLKQIMTDIVVNSMKMSVGIVESAVIEDGSNKDFDFWVDDTFDIVFDPMASNIQDARFIIKTKAKPISDIEEKYGVKVKADNKRAAAQYKEMLEVEKHEESNSGGSDDLETVIIKEIWLKWEDGERDKEGEFIEEPETKIRVITTAGNEILRVYEPNYRRYPFFKYTPERESGVMYPDSWIKDLISPNKSLDKTVSSIESYIQRMLSGKWLIKQGVEVSSITDEGAEKIYYNGSVPPVQQNLQPLPSAPFSYVDSLERWIEEFGGMREASLGRTPGSLQSGKAIEALQSADAQVVAEPVENMEILLQEIGEFCLEVISDYEISSNTITEGNETIKYIGDVEEPPEGAMIVKPSKIKVKIVPEIAYTEEAKLERLLQLAQIGIVDPQTILEKLNISNISDVLERLEKANSQKFQENIVNQRESHRTDSNGPEDTADLANQENMKMMAGEEVPMTPKSLWLPEHTKLHIAFLQQNRQDIESNPQIKQIFEAHIMNEQQYEGSGQQPQQQQPQQPNQ